MRSPITSATIYNQLPNGSTRASTITYNGSFNGSGLVSDDKEYDFGVSLGSVPSSTYLKRETTISYASLGNGIINKPAQSSVLDWTTGSSVVVASTTYTYDQALSHELHSSKLEYLGVIADIKSWCKEFAERSNVEINFRNDVSSVVPFEMGVSLFRILQEALHNAVKHSGVKRVEVRLTEQSIQVHLIVSDSGKGFDVKSAMQGKGLGLTSMKERVRLVNGTIAIESKPMGGTTIDVLVPLESQQVRKKMRVQPSGD